MDRISKKRRSWNMSRIKSKDTSPEIIVRKFLFSKGLRYRCNYKIIGKPDIVFPKSKIAVFVHGCFWHLHGCNNSGFPKTNTRFWKIKLTENRLRDKRVKRKLTKMGWCVFTLWECELERDTKKHLGLVYKAVKNCIGDSRLV